uniref:Kinesin-like protein n=1 Tax=Mesocestoides corti TaxID=53468 RepID=A0A5K3FL88_MESCO
MYGTPDAPGIVPRITEDLFSLIAGKKASNSLISVHLNYFEIYKEKINDLLQDKKPAPQVCCV